MKVSLNKLPTTSIPVFCPHCLESKTQMKFYFPYSLMVFVCLNLEHIKLLEKYKYFDGLYSLAIAQPYHPLLIRNLIPPFKRFVRLGKCVFYPKGFHVADGGVRYINDRFFSALHVLRNYPDMISDVELTNVIKEFETFRTR
ncbi:hypothetical protein RF11_13987 [Thelohanellus kitauei]|uniref:Uncharacterized protein n=1 Tax=Thelohanellus kitauei TaxID=669202 RepID=A0A0C2I744_THEKT|nr:hypothetical protein RF11_13987 [Thelohanellus kitauei]